MTELLITEEQIRTVVSVAARAPSGDNTQPWTFLWDGQALRIDFQPVRARHVLDAGFSASTVALGCLLETIQIAASDLRMRAEFDTYLLTDRSQPAATVRFFSHAAQPDPLRDAVSRRTTDRRPFQKGPLPSDDLNAMRIGQPGKDLVDLHFQEKISPELIDYIVSAESLVTLHPSIFLETLRWIRLSHKEALRTKDGMPWRGTGVSALEYPALRLMRSIPSAFRVLSRTGMAKVHKANVRRLVASSAGLFCLSTSQPGPAALLHVGRLSTRLWLRLTQLGYGVQPLTLSSLMIYNFKIGVLDSHSQRLFRPGYLQAEQVLRKAFGIPAANTPVWMFRTGLASPLPESWVSPRLDLDSILRISLK